jgi:hypothetical protein
MSAGGRGAGTRVFSPTAGKRRREGRYDFGEDDGEDSVPAIILRSSSGHPEL